MLVGASRYFYAGPFELAKSEILGSAIDVSGSLVARRREGPILVGIAKIAIAAAIPVAVPPRSRN